MKRFLYYFFIALFLLVLEGTVLSSVFKKFFDLIGIGSVSYFCVDTTLIVCIFFALTRDLGQALFMAFAVGYLKDIFILGGAWINPFVYVLCVVLTNILKKIIMLRGISSIMVYVFSLSIFYGLAWMFMMSNLFPESSAFGLGVYAILPNALVNGVFGWLLYALLSWLDRQFGAPETNGRFAGREKMVQY